MPFEGSRVGFEGLKALESLAILRMLLLMLKITLRENAEGYENAKRMCRWLRER